MKSKFIILLSVLSVLFLSGCDVYQSLYGESDVPLENISDEVDKTLDEIIPSEDMAGSEDKPACGDGIDNDNDGFIDYPIDFGCDSLEDDNEVNDGDLMCNNGVDDDKDGFVDENDPGCNGFRKERGLEELAAEDVSEEEKEKQAEDLKEAQSDALSGDAVVITVQETDLVNLVPDAEDPDDDDITFAFTSPVDETGKWKTYYGDAGEYTISVTASDGELSTSQDVLVIVKRKEEKPVIDSFKPMGDQEIKETESIGFSVEASDLNKDKLTYLWKLDGKEVSSSESYDFESTFDDSGKHTVEVIVSDGISEAKKSWEINIFNVNRKPTLDIISEIVVKETELVSLNPVSEDADGDKIVFKISEPVGDDGEWKTTYDDAGTYTVSVSATDGTDTVEREVKIVVENVNRPPVIKTIIQKS